MVSAFASTWSKGNTQYGLKLTTSSGTATGTISAYDNNVAVTVKVTLVYTVDYSYYSYLSNNSTGWQTASTTVNKNMSGMAPTSEKAYGTVAGSSVGSVGY